MVKNNSEENINAVLPEDTINALVQNYVEREASIARQLQLKIPNHQLTTGTTREVVWGEMFKAIVPKKFYIDQGVFVIDSFGNISPEIDLAIFDEQYTPYIFRYENIKFIPIEAVAVVVQCKSKTLDGGVYDWLEKIKQLKTSPDSVLRMSIRLVHNDFKQLSADNLKYDEKAKEASSQEQKSELLRKKQYQSQTSTRPISILCVSSEEASVTKRMKEDFDIVLQADKEGLIQKTIHHEDDDDSYWYEQLNHYDLKRYGSEYEVYESLKPEIKPINRSLKDLKVQESSEVRENTLLSLTLQLNQLLMFLNNPIPFPHRAYANMFRNNYTRFREISLLRAKAALKGDMENEEKSPF